MLSSETKRLLADNDWGVGTILIGRESVKEWWSESTIMLTYVSEQTLLALKLARRSSTNPSWRAGGHEGHWTLDARPWREATAADLRDAKGNELLVELADEYPVLGHLAGLEVARLERGESTSADDSLRFELEMTDSYIERVWEVVFGPDKPSPTIAESFCVGPRRTALKRILAMCSRVEWPWLAAKRRPRGRPKPKDLPLGVELEDIDG